jgi:hypothetical protein
MIEYRILERDGESVYWVAANAWLIIVIQNVGLIEFVDIPLCMEQVHL